METQVAIPIHFYKRTKKYEYDASTIFEGFVPEEGGQG